MLSIGKIGGAGAASAYYNADDYYTRDETSPSEWFGAGAEALGLAGPVEKEAFQRALDGHVGESGERLGREVGGEWKHRAGWDLTFSAPKSVSIMAEVGGDARLVKAHDEAVRATLAKIEKEVVGARVMEEGRKSVERTGSMVAALFRHDLSRNHDPQLHTHAVIANMTKAANGWRSLYSDDFYHGQKAFGLHYRQELALRVRALGYEIDQDGKGGFEIAGLSEKVRDAFSTRRKEIEAKLAEMGEGAEKDAAAAERAAIATRKPKRGMSREDAAEIWKGRVGDPERREIEALRARAEGREGEAKAGLRAPERDRNAALILKRAVEIHAEREAAFSKERLLETANRIALGRATEGDIERALARSVKRGDLVGKTVIEADRKAQADLRKEGLAREETRILEQKMLDIEKAGRGAAARLTTPKLAQAAIHRAESESRRAGHEWTPDQRAATAGLLMSRNRVHAVQGLAGTAKTSTVLATFAREARRLGKEVVAMAPTGSAAETLGAALKGRGKTVAQHLIDTRRPDPAAGRQIWIVDEASMLSTAQTAQLLERVSASGARMVLVGDVRQLGSVEAGAAFRQLQEAGMPTERLERIVRQTNDRLRAAVEQAAIGQAARALSTIGSGGGEIVAGKDDAERREAIASRWLALDAKGRAETIVVEPSRKGRDLLNARIRAGLVTEGTLGADALASTRLEAKGLTTPEKKMAMSYAKGDVIRFRRSYRFEGETVAKGDYVTVRGVDQGAGVVGLATSAGARIDWRPARRGAGMAEVYEPKEGELRVGDRISWTHTDKGRGLRNGERGEVVRIDGEKARVRFDRLGNQEIDLRRNDDRHWRHAYAETAYAAQGRTSDRVIVHAEARRVNLINEKAFYVAISRAREEGVVVTDDLRKLSRALSARAGEKETALESGAASAAQSVAAPRTPLARRIGFGVREALTPRAALTDGRIRDAVARAAAREEAEADAPRQNTPRKVLERRDAALAEARADAAAGRPRTLEEIAARADRKRAARVESGEVRRQERGGLER